MSDQGGTPEAGWHPDPHGRHEYRYWDGSAWTDQVSDGGVQATDPPGEPEATAAEEPVAAEEPPAVVPPTVAADATAPMPVVDGPPMAGAPAGPPPAEAAVAAAPPGGSGSKLSVGLLAIVALVAAAIVAVLVIFVFGGDDDSSGAGEFSGTIDEDNPFIVRTLELDAGQPFRVIVEPDDDLDARLTLAVGRDVAASPAFSGLIDEDVDEDDLDDLDSDYYSDAISGYTELFSESIDEDLSSDLSQAGEDGFGDFSELLAEELPVLAEAGIPTGTEDFGTEGDPEGTVFLAPVDGTYSVIISGQGTEGEVEGNIEVGDVDEDFDLDPDEPLDFVAFLEAWEPHLDFFCDEEFYGDDPEDVSEFAATLCDEDAFNELLSTDVSSDFSDDFSDDFSSDFSDDFSSDVSDDFSDDFSTGTPEGEFVGTIGVGESASGFIEPEGSDIYDLDVPGGGPVVIRVLGTYDTGGLDPTVEVLDSAGVQIGFDDDGGARSRDSRLEVTLEPGETYQVIVAGFANYSGDYRIRVS